MEIAIPLLEMQTVLQMEITIKLLEVEMELLAHPTVFSVIKTRLSEISTT